MLCKSCGAEVREGASFCGKCGAEISCIEVSKSFNEEEKSIANFVSKTTDDLTKESNNTKKTLIIVAVVSAIIIGIIFIICILRDDSNSNSNSNYYSYTGEYVDDTYSEYEEDEATTLLEDDTNKATDYISSIDDLTSENIGRFKSFAEGYYSNEDFGDTENPTMEYVGNIILLNKEQNNGSEGFVYNKLVLVYKIHMRNIYLYVDKTTDFYWFMGYNNVDNNFTFINNYAAAKEHPDYFRPESYIDIDGPDKVLWQYRGQYSISDLIAEEFSNSTFEIVENNVY